MTNNQELIDKLNDFKLEEKFTENAWNEMGMNPSTPEISIKVEKLLNECADELIAATKSNKSKNDYKSILKGYLKKFNKSDYDTEEKELICEYFHELSTFFNIDLDLDKWLYGSLIATMGKLKNKINPEKIVDTLKHPCTKCGVQLETLVTAYGENIPSYSYFVVKCDNCKEYNLLDLGPNLKGFKKGNYDFIEQLRKDEFTNKQALTKLEQIKASSQK
jgi:hypothetical protein